MRIGKTMGMAVSTGGIEARSLHLEQGNAEGRIDVTRAAPVDCCIAMRRQQPVEPMIVAESDPDDD